MLKMGIVGTGMIANIIAKAIQSTKGIELVGVASRQKDSANSFAVEFGINHVFKNWQELVQSKKIEAVYIATPTSIREEIAILAINNKKHLLAEKPFASFESVQRITKAAKNNKVAFMDATHFVHHPRTKILKRELKKKIGNVHTIRSTFFFPLMARDNIRFDGKKEPTGALGDMAWYNMKAIVEYMQERGKLKQMSAMVHKDKQTGAIINGSGLAVFENGKHSSFDFGYNAGVCLMDLDILADNGMIRLDDYVLDWSKGFTFDNPKFKVGYTVRKEMMIPDDFEFIVTNSEETQVVYMIKNFIALTKDPEGDKNSKSIDSTLQTQYLIDEIYKSIK